MLDCHGAGDDVSCPNGGANGGPATEGWDDTELECNGWANWGWSGVERDVRGPNWLWPASGNCTEHGFDPLYKPKWLPSEEITCDGFVDCNATERRGSCSWHNPRGTAASDNAGRSDYVDPDASSDEKYDELAGYSCCWLRRHEPDC